MRVINEDVPTEFGTYKTILVENKKTEVINHEKAFPHF